MKKFLVVLNILSIACSVLVIFTVLLIRWYRKPLADRMSFRLTAYVAFADILLSTSLLLRWLDIKSDPTYIGIVRWAIVTTALCSTFLGAAITLNLQLIFLHNKQIASYYEYYYVLGSFIFSLAIVVPSAILRVHFSSMVLPVTVTVSSIYCLSVVFIICYRFYKASEDIQLKPSGILGDRVIRKATFRILLYPSVLIISQLPFSIAFALTRLANTSSSTDIGMYTMSLQGILNAFAFTFDPAFGAIYKFIENDLIVRYYINESYVSQEKPLPALTIWFVKKYLVPETSQQVKRHEQLTITISEKQSPTHNGLSEDILRMI